MDDEIRIFSDGRPAAPAYRPEARDAARRRLLDEATGRRRAAFRFPRLGWQAVGAFGVTLALVGGVGVALSSRPAPVPAAAPGADATESAEVVPAVRPSELAPKPGQYILVQSETMYTSQSFYGGKKESRYLYRTARKIWRSVDGSKTGLLYIEGRSPKPYPGWPIPEEAKKWQGADWSEIEKPCTPERPENRRFDYAYLSTLPTDKDGMRDYLYKSSRREDDGGKQIPPDSDAWTLVGDLLRENYMPRAQRQALFEAARTIPGVRTAEGVEDSAGRKGTALGRPANGTLAQLIFDPETYMFLGEREVVVDRKAAGAPVGSVLALTAELSVSVVDELPKAEGVHKDGSCDMMKKPAATTPPTDPAGPQPSNSQSPTGPDPSDPPTAQPTGSDPSAPPTGPDPSDPPMPPSQGAEPTDPQPVAS
ncbi:CU044_5270 family protein [Sphaerisporangium fuscum]|uniref:CU044_5270 family protein n=1 Tax=Sphaerisporangium fuscum TaxID=2835868 RepID=UPI001BDC8CB5|nr:CU044_5270 family protein [Sphaerisporangium fuscum]